ncbi:hypothetical protein [Leptospira bandrabouensis]
MSIFLLDKTLPIPCNVFSIALMMERATSLDSSKVFSFEIAIE